MKFGLHNKISVHWLPVYFGVQTAIIIDSNYSVQEGHGTITSACFLGELNLVIYGIYVFKKLSSCVFLMKPNVSSTNLLQNLGDVVLC